MSLRRWTCKSAAKLASALQTQGHAVSERTVNRLSMPWATVSNPTARRSRAATTRTGMRNASP
jgi:hypothetical protein